MALCRLCLTNVKKEETVSTTNKQMLERIKECVSLEINLHFDVLHGFPSNVCKKCIKNLNDWHKFKKTCIKTDSLLKRDIETAQGNDRAVEKTVADTSADTNNIVITRSGKNSKENIDYGNYLQLLKQFREIRPKPEGGNKDSELIYDDDLNTTVSDILLDFKEDLKFEANESYDIENNHENHSTNGESIFVKKESDEEEYYFEDSTVEFHFRTYTCEFCQKEFDMFLEYLEHQDEHEGEPVFKCDKCIDEVFTSKSELSEHEAGHKISCELCGVMVLKQSMNAHRIRHTDRFKCSQCSYKFSNRPFLEKHIKAVHCKIKNEVCEVCGKCFSTNNSLRIHLQSHGERTYQCKVCDFAGKTSSSLLLHSSKHLRETHVCDMCSKVFKSYRNLYDHLRRVHTAEKKHVCTWKQCQMRFIDKYMLRTHMRIHTGSRPYPCSKCDKKFIRSDSLKEHMKTHDRTVFFECSRCLKKFTTNRGKTRHKCMGSGSS